MTRDKFGRRVLGNLPEDEAKIFLLGNTEDPEDEWPGIINGPNFLSEVPAVSEEQWLEIYNRCGGNIGLLGDCATFAREYGDWNAALDEATGNDFSLIKEAFYPKMISKRDVPPLWTWKHWKLVLERITEADYNAVLLDQLLVNLELSNFQEPGGVQAEDILLSMVKYNLLAIRSPSAFAFDLPRKVFGGTGMQEVVTLPLPSHVWSANVIMGKIEVTQQIKTPEKEE